MSNVVFILSLPRSGSTLLQKALSCSGDVATTSEPWLLLPLFYALREEGGYAEYSSTGCFRALRDLECELKDRGGKSLEAYFSDTVKNIYGDLSEGKKYFLDKTPRNILLADTLFESFEEAKFVVLWRNPLAVIASMMKTWCDGDFKVYMHYVDIYKGMSKLLDFSRQNMESDRVFTVKYEEFVLNSGAVSSKLFHFLEVDLVNIDVDRAEEQLSGSMGDPLGFKKYRGVSSDSIEEWKGFFCNPVRKWWARRYLEGLGRDVIEMQGYNYDELIFQMECSKNVCGLYVLKDVFYIMFGWFHRRFLVRILKNRLLDVLKGKELFDCV